MRYFPLTGLSLALAFTSVAPRAEAAHMTCLTHTTIRGIDVSANNSIGVVPIDWATAAAGGVVFATIRATDGLSTDDTFAVNWSAAHAAHVIVGGYHFFRTAIDPAAQANHLADVLLAAGFGPGDLPPLIDIEQPFRDATHPTLPVQPTQTEYTNLIRTFVFTITARLHVTPMIYVGAFYWDGDIASTEFAALPLFHPQYPGYFGALDPRNTIRHLSDPLPGCPSISNAWTAPTFWQFAGDNGRAPGLTNPIYVDLDVFDGTMDDLLRLTGVGPAIDGGVPMSDGGAPLDVVMETPDVAAMGDVLSATDATVVDAFADVVAHGDAQTDAAGNADAGASSRAGCGCRAMQSRGQRSHSWLLAGLALAGAAHGRRRARRSA